MKRISGYSKIWPWGHIETESFIGKIQVQEKVDGSQISFGILDGVLNIKSKNALINPHDPPELFKKAVDYIIELGENHKLSLGYVYRGEVLKDKKHNALEYSIAPKHNIILFDIETSPCNFMGYIDLIFNAKLLDLEAVPRLGTFNSKDEIENKLDDFLEIESCLGGVNIEGIVIKPVSPVDIVYDKMSKVVMIKYVSDKFKEINDKNWKVLNPNRKDIIQKIAETVSSEPRWEKAVQTLQELGIYQGTLQDIGQLQKYISFDIQEECEEIIKEMLFNNFKNDILRVSIKEIPNWYKGKINEK